MKITILGKPVWINYHHLYCFYVVGKEGGLARASQFLGIGQSALSIQIKQLEDHLNVRLLERGHGKIIFTASMLSFQGGVNVPGYTAAKSGVAGLTKALANEWAGRGVNVNAIAGITRDFRGRQIVSVKGHPQKLEVSRSYTHLFKGM